MRRETSMGDASLLLVRQRPVPHPELESLIDELRDGFGLDPYVTRQRLLGAGLAQLAQGERQSLDGPVATLRRHGYACWVIAPQSPRFAPPRLRSLTIGAEAIDFLCEGDSRIRLERGMPAVGVLADLSGELAGRQVKRMLARNAYLGREQAGVFTPEETRQAILKGQPVFDCYLQDDQNAVTAAFRVLPGRFNPEGLGGRASLSAARNLEAVLDLVGEYAGNFRLHSDFGLSQLPGCLPQPVSDNNPTALLGNLDALTRYGWLVSGLAEPPSPGGDAANLPGSVLAAGLGGAAAVAGMVGSPELKELADVVNTAATDSSPVAKSTARPAPLPPPPDRPERQFSLRRALPVVVAFLSGAVLVAADRVELLRPLFRQAVNVGALPAAVAIALCWGGFVCLRLKRLIEDTPTSRIRSLAMGLVEVHGRALRRYALVAPMTQGACVWYRLRKYRRDQNNRWTQTSESDSNHVPFVLDDGSGQVVVDPAGATIKVKTVQTGYPGESTLIGSVADGGPDEKWVEELIYEGTTLYVLGFARPSRGGRPSLRELTVAMVRRLKLDPQALRRYDVNGDGRLDSDEWQGARDDAERLAAAEQLNVPATPATACALLEKPPRGLPYLIAEGQSGTELAGRYGWIGAVLMVLGVTAFGLALKLSLEFFRVF
jgi:hypothetical protein